MHSVMKKKIIQLANKTSACTGKFISFLILPIVCLPTYEVLVKRYLLNRPTIWTQEFTLSLFAVYFLIGGAYTLKAQGFVAMDILYNRFERKSKIIADTVILASILFFCGVLIYHGSIWAWASITTGERSGSLWNPVVWPVRIMIPLGAGLVAFQAVSNFLQARLETEKVPLSVEGEREMRS